MFSTCYTKILKFTYVIRLRDGRGGNKFMDCSKRKNLACMAYAGDS